MIFSEIAKSLRKSANLTQTELAEKLKVSKSCISMIEIGKNEPTANTLVRYADFFDCTTDFLLGRADDYHILPATALSLETVSTDEQSLIKTYRKLNSTQKTYVKAYIDIRLEEQSKTANFPI